MGRHPNYEILKATPLHVRIRDLGPWDKHLTVTNGAEDVVLELYRRGLLGSQTKLTYFDTENIEDELRHDGRGNFLGFGAGSPILDDIK